MSDEKGNTAEVVASLHPLEIRMLRALHDSGAAAESKASLGGGTLLAKGRFAISSPGLAYTGEETGSVLMFDDRSLYAIGKCLLEEPGARPTRLSFIASSPSSLTGSLQFRMALPYDATVALEIFDVQGRQVRSLAKGMRPAGTHAVEWDGHDSRGNLVGAGQNLARLRIRGDGRQRMLTRKLLVTP